LNDHLKQCAVYIPSVDDTRLRSLLDRFKKYLDESIDHCVMELRDFDWNEYINQTPGFLGAARLPLTELDPDRINSVYRRQTVVEWNGEENQSP
jgi:hypothetical protein